MIRKDGIMDPDGKYPNPLTGLPYSKQYIYQSSRIENGKIKGWRDYTPWKDRIEIFKKIHKYNILLAILPPGTGKTVIIPKLLLHYFGYQRKIICTTPRTGTTSSAGEFAAKCLDVPIFQVDDMGNNILNTEENENQNYLTGMLIVGYKFSGKKNFSDSTTLLLFTTDGTLKQMILAGNDPNLSAYGGIIIDEAHERSINIDIIIALLLDIVKRRPDFKVIIMSATIDEIFFTDYFKRVGLGDAYSVYIVKKKAELYKRDEIKLSVKLKNQSKFIDDIYTKINSIILNPSLPVGDILAFVTSDSETKKLKNSIDKNMSAYPINNKPYAIAFSAKITDADKSIATKKGSLLTDVPPSQQAPQGYNRKVIIGTNAVESSITFADPLVYVIESGLAYEKTYDAKKYCYNTGVNFVSQASIAQRCGRTGRTCDGICYQLYTEEQYKSFERFAQPQILADDLTKELLGLICLPMNGNLLNTLEFMKSMIEPIKNYQPAIARAYNNLINMDLIDKAGNLLPLGKICNSFNKFDIKIAKMCIGGYYLGCLPHMIVLGAIISTVMGIDDIFFKPLDIDKNPEIERKFNENVEKHKHLKGDHITLFIIYTKWNQSPDQDEFAKQNYLSISTLRKIKTQITDLETEIKKMKRAIKNLYLFSVPSEIVSLSGGNINNTTSKLSNNFINNLSNNFKTKLSNKDIKDLLNDIDIKNDITKVNNSSKTSIETLLNNSKHVGRNDTRNINNTPTSIIRKPHSGKANHKKTFTSKTVPLSKQTKHNAATATANATRTRNKPKPKPNTRHTKKQHRMLKTKHKNTLNKINIGGARSNKSKKDYKKDDKKDYKKDDKKITVIKNLLDLITLEGLQPRIMKPHESQSDNMLSSLFYGFSNNIGCYTGNTSQYHVKFSHLKGSISKSTYDNSKIIPDFIIYNEFLHTPASSGRPAEFKLNIVSELKLEHMTKFINLKELINKK